MSGFVRVSCYVAALLSVSMAAPAAAEDLGGGFTVNGGATVVSDYRFRGISQTDKRFAIQGTFTVGHSSGVYGSVWGSSIDDYVAAGADAELDLIFGYKKTFGSTTIDGGLLYYYYPGSGGANTDFAEPYLKISQAMGAATLTGTIAYAPKQKALTVGNGKEDNLYLAGDLGYAIPKTPVSLTAHFGHSFGPSYLTIGDGYSDWSLGATVTHKNLSAGISYVDTNKSLYSPSGRNISKAGVVATLGVAF
ncbi:TorF family putative porin [Sphingomonas daechungensis]|uniref:TorF family putative porin n=1 Tax=Sphingomonas daechungensis TaxID=1176646 RepID=UPI00378477C0